MKFNIKEIKYTKNDTFVLELADGFEFILPKNNAKVTLYNSFMIDFYIRERYLIKYKKLLSLMLLILNDDDNSDTDFEIALNEITRLESVVLNEYKKYLKIENIKKMLKEIYILKEELRKKMELTYRMSQGISR